MHRPAARFFLTLMRQAQRQPPAARYRRVFRPVLQVGQHASLIERAPLFVADGGAAPALAEHGLVNAPRIILVDGLNRRDPLPVSVDVVAQFQVGITLAIAGLRLRSATAARTQIAEILERGARVDGQITVRQPDFGTHDGRIFRRRASQRNPATKPVS